MGAVVLERRHGLAAIDGMAVDAAYRRRGIAGRLYAALEREARARGITRLWVTARTPGFFAAMALPRWRPSRERDILVRECLRCEQFGHGCEPRALTKQMDDTGPPGGPQSEGETWHDRD